MKTRKTLNPYSGSVDRSPDWKFESIKRELLDLRLRVAELERITKRLRPH